MSVAIECECINKRYGEKETLKNISFKINRGECIALLGQNGAGKTTLLNIMLEKLYPTSGNVKNKYQVSEIGYLMQSTKFPDDIKVKELISFVSKFSTNPLDLEQILRILEFTPEMMGQIASKLSGGQKRLLDFCLTIISHPKLLVLDEPTSGMDEDTRAHFWRIVNELKEKGTTVIFTTHYSDEVNNGADRVLLLKSGELVADESPFHLRTLNNKRTLTFEKSLYNNQTLRFKSIADGLMSLIEINIKKNTVQWEFDSQYTNQILTTLVKENVDMTSVELSNASLMETIFEEGEKDDSFTKDRMA